MKGFGEQDKSRKTINNKILNSKEQIINQAIQFHLKGNIPEATKYYQYCINQGFNDQRVFSNYGVILKNLGNLKEAEVITRKSIELNPNFADAHSNLGNILGNLGHLQEAQNSYRKAIELNPNFANAHLNLGSILRDLGKLQDAEVSIRKAIELNPNFANAHLNLGSILRDLGKLQDAEVSIRKAIEIKPDLAQAHSNLGVILKDFGKLQEAELATRKAIELNPNFANAHSNLGSILRDLGKLQDAEIFTRNAIELNPNLADAYSNMGNILSDLGKLQEALDFYIKVIELDPKFPNIYTSITRFLSESNPSQFNQSKLKYIITLLLQKNDISHRELMRTFNFAYSNEMIKSLEKFDSEFQEIALLNNDKIIINALKKIIFSDVKLEELLTKIRRNICHHIFKNQETLKNSGLEFIIALGEQCFLNEYVYSSNEEEKLFLNTIIKRCQNNELNETKISILSCYFPLYKLLDKIPSLKSFNSSNQSFKELIELQLKEPLKEIELSQKIKKLGKINDGISQKVKSQYEQNPYPRWRYGTHQQIQKKSISQLINSEIKPNSIDQNRYYQKLKVLIAGCGTGNQILQTQRYKNAQITGIDLSLSSLAYAQRKINELEIDNVELIQMDILEVSLLEEQFDIIECSGVIHHMNDPSKGLKALLNTLKNNGYLKLGLYSELARKDIVEAREYISTKNLQPNAEDIKDFREEVFSGKIDQISNLRNWSDFYTMSECRDLCFHSREHRFTINQLQETLELNNLEFLGFLLPKTVKSVYEQYFPKDRNQTNLRNWEKFEEQYPSTFSGMYQFWVCKMNT